MYEINKSLFFMKADDTFEIYCLFNIMIELNYLNIITVLGFYIFSFILQFMVFYIHRTKSSLQFFLV